MSKNIGKFDKIMTYVSGVTIILATTLVLYFGYCFLYPFNVFDAKEPLRVLNSDKQVEVGGYLKVEENYCKYMSLPAVTTLTLHNEIIVGLPLRYGNIPIGCHIRTTIIKIPETALIVGKAYLKFDRVYKINAFREVTESSETEEFEIVAKKDGEKI